MNFLPTAVEGVLIVEPQLIGDERGFFFRAWCRKEFEEQGLAVDLVQGNMSYNVAKGTMRGLHYQVPPAAEAKLFRCIRGSIFDVVVDMREESPTYLQSVTTELTAESKNAIYIPERCAHGYQTLERDCEMSYLVSEYYSPENETGVRYDDPVLDIQWPLPVENVTDKDLSWELLASS